MVIRGAPAAGVAAAIGMALGSMGIGIDNFDDFSKKLSTIGDKLASTRPTAVNLFWAIERMKMRRWRQGREYLRSLRH